MSYNDKKIISLLFEEIENIPERYYGYNNELKSTLAEILNLERQHAISRINIIQKISDQVNKLGKELHKNNSMREE